MFASHFSPPCSPPQTLATSRRCSLQAPPSPTTTTSCRVQFRSSLPHLLLLLLDHCQLGCAGGAGERRGGGWWEAGMPRPRLRCMSAVRKRCKLMVRTTHRPSRRDDDIETGLSEKKNEGFIGGSSGPSTDLVVPLCANARSDHPWACRHLPP